MRELHVALDGVRPDDAETVLRRHYAGEVVWRGVHPFEEQSGVEAVADVFWRPFSAAFSALQRRTDIFFAGENWEDGGETVWVCSMGHLLGLFDRSWLGIPATAKMAFLRYVEFNRVDGGKVVETTFLCDLIDLMRQ